jgi:hypothetical protein
MVHILMVTNKLLFWFVVCSLVLWVAVSEWQYVEQFAPGTEQLPLPRTVLFSIFMGKVGYPHMPLLLESMRRNPGVDFKLINIIQPGSEDANDVIALKNKLAVPNFEVHVLDMNQFSAIVNERLKLSIQFTKDWYYKMCDFKPTLAYLFPELSRNDTYKYWGYVDMDLIWGNISRFSHWFQGQYPFIHSGENILTHIYLNSYVDVS